MRAECVQAVTEAATAMGLKKPPRINDIEQAIRDNLKQAAREDRDAFNAMPVEERYIKAGERAVKDAQHQAIRKRMLADIEIQAAARREATFNDMLSKGLTGVEAAHHVLNFVADGRGGYQSVESLSNAQSAIFKSKLDKLFQFERDNTILGIMTNKQWIDDLRKEAFGQDSGNPQAKEAYRNFAKINSEMIDMFNRVGGDISKRADWHLPQYLSEFKLQKLTMPTFVKNWMEFVNRNEYVNPDGTLMNDAQMAKFLEEAFYTQVTGGANRRPGEGHGASSIANRRQAHRQIIYKSAEAYAKAMDLAGEGTVMEQIHKHIDSMARDITIAGKVSPNADLAVRALLAKAIDHDVRATGGTYDAGKVIDITTAWEQMTGIYDDKMKVAGRHYVNETKSAFVASRLGTMVLAQISDMTTIISVSHAMSIPLSAVMANAVKYAASPEFRSTAKSMAYALESTAHSISRMGDQASSYGSMSKVAGLVVNLQGANAWNNMWRGALGTAMAAQTSQMNMKYKTLADLPEWDRRVLESKGVTDQDWSLWKKAGRDTYGMFSHREIEDIPLSEVRKIVPEIERTVYEANEAFIKTMSERTAKETKWVSGRESKLSEYKQKINDMLESFKQTRDKRKEGLSERNMIRAGELGMRVELAEIDAQIAKQSVDEMHGNRTDKFMEQVKRGVEWYGRRRSEIGERLGAQRHAAKLAEYANESRIESIGNEIIAKFNSLFGAEGKDADGFKIVGKVVAAAKEYESYANKMEQRIAKATRRDGTPKNGKEGTISRDELLSENARIEFEAIQQRAINAMDELKSKSEGKIQEIDAMQKLVEQKKLRAETEADIAAYLETEKSIDKIETALDTVEFRASQGASRAMSEGERLGYRKGLFEGKLREMKKQESKYETQTKGEVWKKAEELDKRLTKREKEFDIFSKEVKERSDNRQEIIDKRNLAVESKIDEAAADYLRDSALKFVSMTLEETHMAILSPSATTKAEMANLTGTGYASLLTQFKTFPWAFYRQHFIDRANFYGEHGGSPLKYRLELGALAIVFGGVSLLLGDIANGRDPRKVFDSPERAAEFGFNAFLRGNGLGILNDLLEVIKSDYDVGDEARLFGPAIGTVVAAANLVGAGSKAMLLEGEEAERAKKNAKKIAYKLATTNIPFQNFWPTKAYVHGVLLHDLQELANPGYMERAKERAQKNYGSEYFMGYGVETRAPNFGNISAP